MAGPRKAQSIIQPGCSMSTVLWIIQVILGIKFLTAAFNHGFRQERLTAESRLQQRGIPARPVLTATALLLLIGCLGLLLPAAGVFMNLPPFAAVGLAVMMLFSIPLHIQCREKPMLIVSLVLFALAVFAAYGRWVLAPL